MDDLSTPYMHIVILICYSDNFFLHGHVLDFVRRNLCENIEITSGRIRIYDNRKSNLWYQKFKLIFLYIYIKNSILRYQKIQF